VNLSLRVITCGDGIIGICCCDERKGEGDAGCRRASNAAKKTNDTITEGWNRLLALLTRIVGLEMPIFVTGSNLI
jgi:hypothetical protein